MKHFFLVFVVLFIGFSGNAQKNIDFISMEIENLEIQLIKKGEHLKLNNIQKESLSKIYEDQYQRVENVISKLSQKEEVSKEILKINEEFKPKVESILSVEQRLAILKNDRFRFQTSSVEKQN